MKYVRLLKDTPEAPTGTIFERIEVNQNRFGWVWVYKALNKDCMFNSDVVEGNDEWFEQVEQIFVKPCNIEALKEIDKVANEGDLIIGQPIQVRI